MNSIPNDIVYLIYKYLHCHNFNIVLFDLLEATSEMKDYNFDYTSDDDMLHTSYIQRCMDCGKKWLYGCNDDGGYRQCAVCFMMWWKKRKLIYDLTDSE